MDSNAILEKDGKGNSKGALSAGGKALALRVAKDRPKSENPNANAYNLPTVETSQSDEERRDAKSSNSNTKKRGLLTADELAEGGGGGEAAPSHYLPPSSSTARGGKKSSSRKTGNGRNSRQGLLSPEGENDDDEGAFADSDGGDETYTGARHNSRGAYSSSGGYQAPSLAGGGRRPFGGGSSAGGSSSGDLVGIVDKHRSASVFSTASQSIMNFLSNSSMAGVLGRGGGGPDGAGGAAAAPAANALDIELQIETTSSLVFRIIFYGWYLLLILAIVLQTIIQLQWSCQNVCGSDCGLLSLDDWRSRECSGVRITTVTEPALDPDGSGEVINVTRSVYDLTWTGSVGYVADDILNRFVHVVLVMPRPNVTHDSDITYDLRFALNVSNVIDADGTISYGETIDTATLRCDGGKSRCKPIFLNTNIAQAATNASLLTIVISDAPKPLADVSREAGVAYVFQHSQYTIATIVVRYSLIFFSFLHFIRFIYHKSVDGLYEQTWVIVLHFALFLYLDPLFAGGIYLRPAPEIFSFIEFRMPIYFIATFVAFMFSVITSAHAWASDDTAQLTADGSAAGSAAGAAVVALYDPPLRTKLIAVSYIAIIVILDIIDGYLHSWDWASEHCPDFNCTVAGFALYILIALGVLVCTCWLWWLRGNLGQKPYFACRAQQLAFRIFVIVFISAVLYLIVQTILVFAIYHKISQLVSFQILNQIGPVIVMAAFVNIMTYVYTSTLRTGKKGGKGDREKGVPIRPMDPSWKETVWEERWYRWLALHGGSMYMFVSEAEEQFFDFVQSQSAIRKEHARSYEDGRDAAGLGMDVDTHHGPTRVGGSGSAGGGNEGGGGHSSGNMFTNMVQNFRNSVSPNFGGGGNAGDDAAGRGRLPSYYEGEMTFTIPEWKLDKDLTPYERLVRQYEFKLALKRRADRERAEAELEARREGFDVVGGDEGDDCGGTSAASAAGGDDGYTYDENGAPLSPDQLSGRGSLGGPSDTDPLRGSGSRERNYDSTDNDTAAGGGMRGSSSPPHLRKTASSSALNGKGGRSSKGRTSSHAPSPKESSRRRAGNSTAKSKRTSANMGGGAASNRNSTAFGAGGVGGGGSHNSAANPFRTVANFGKGVVNTIVDAPTALGEGIARLEDGFISMGYALGGQAAVQRKPFFNLETCVDLFNLSWEVYGRPTPAADLYLITEATAASAAGRSNSATGSEKRAWYKRLLFFIRWGDEEDEEEEAAGGKGYDGYGGASNTRASTTRQSSVLKRNATVGSRSPSPGRAAMDDMSSPLAAGEGAGGARVGSAAGGGPGDTAFVSIAGGGARGLTSEMSISAGDPTNKTMPLAPLTVTRAPLAGGGDGAGRTFASDQHGIGTNNNSNNNTTNNSSNNSKAAAAQQQQQTASQADAAAAAAAEQTPPICTEQYGYELVAVHEALDVQTIICIMDTNVGIHRGKTPRIVVAFRGSTNLSNFEQDVRFTRVRWTEMPARSALSDKWVGPTVHQGFLNVWSALRHFVLTEVQEIHRTLSERQGPNGQIPQVYLTGHSLGGAIATLCAYAMKKTLRIEPIVYTFGAPIVGNKGFKDEYNREIRRTFRVVNESDMVVSLTQFGGHHVGIEAAIDRMGNFICEPMFIERWLRPTQGKGFAAQNHLMGAYGASLNAIVQQARFGRCPIECQRSYFEPHERSVIMAIASRRKMHELRLQEKESGAYDAGLHDTMAEFVPSSVGTGIGGGGYATAARASTNVSSALLGSASNYGGGGRGKGRGGGGHDPYAYNPYPSPSAASFGSQGSGSYQSSPYGGQTYFSEDHVGNSTAGGGNRYTGYRY